MWCTLIIPPFTLELRAMLTFSGVRNVFAASESKTTSAVSDVMRLSPTVDPRIASMIFGSARALLTALLAIVLRTSNVAMRLNAADLRTRLRLSTLIFDATTGLLRTMSKFSGTTKLAIALLWTRALVMVGSHFVNSSEFTNSEIVSGAKSAAMLGLFRNLRTRLGVICLVNSELSNSD